ncbi:MAG: hypothetical protein CME85_03490 [Henriciella sp.]|jgi:phosphohistidine phosphatase|uniref:SixA phosphatase family protein n=1 Tax=Henriciella sp. TaxID=1968823 RepID=UPI000C0F66B8|nr:histidine phosphatase family protein [Henriciella sp.]MAN74401.1 hypothetical protein [Henriciella sp.]MBF34961.1 hypothetical protein [Hyphomonadaceae bacterium]MBK74544.1 hypothetical protein [Henriciella sp.]PHR77263.1 MAG: hypothetical protein COA64_09490 [Henriciella sp.]|tara:strand:+ start:1150 stop:1668 length:519 start_codon:yes stop_codon:yes gene_type:complete
MRRLILLRHAKTEIWHEGLSDRDRKLVERGHQDAETVAAQLDAIGWAPDHALVSTARRTRETWRHVHEVFPACDVKLSDSLYLASVPTLTDLVAQAANACSTLIVIGHNPGLHDLAVAIMRKSGASDPRVARKLEEKLPTGTAVLFESDEDETFIPVHFRMTGWVRRKALLS